MPLIHASIDPKSGACLQVRVRDILVKALVDTGAEYSSIDRHLAKSLGLKQVDELELLTPTGTEKKPVYEGTMTLFHPRANMTLDKLRLVEAELAEQDLDALIGRDVLAHCIMQWNGPMRTMAITF